MIFPAQWKTRLAKWIFPLFLLVVLTACQPIAGDDQPTQSIDFVIRDGQSIGQTFVANQDGLAGIEIYLTPQAVGAGEITLHLRAQADSTQDITTSQFPAAAITSPDYYRFSFQPQEKSNRRYFYAFAEMKGEAAVGVSAAPGDAYLNGSAYQDHLPIDAQLTFRLLYQPGQAFLGWGREVINWCAILILSLFLFVLPGWGILGWVWDGWSTLSWATKLSLASGFSLALYPLLLIWTDLVGLHLGRWYAWLPPLMGLGLIVWRKRGRRIGSPKGFQKSDKAEQRQSKPLLAKPGFYLVLMLGLIFLVRMWAIRSLETPMWGDAYQHTMIAQLVLDNGGIFTNWLPYVPYGSFTVQHGFSVMAAILSWISGEGSVRSVLVVGQVMNVLAVLVIYPLAVKLARGNAWAGVGAVLIAGLLSPMPAFYVNWGRYAQLAGQAVLPVALWMLWESLETIPSKFASGDGEKESRQSPRLWSRWVLAGITLGGMMLSYYRMPYYYAAFALALLIAWGMPRWRLDLPSWLRAIGIMAGILGVAIVVFLPWWTHMFGSNLAATVESGIIRGRPLERVLADYQVWRNFSIYIPWLILALAAAGLVWGLVRRNWQILVMPVWVLGLSSLVASSLIRLPGANLMENFAILIALYIPFGILGGYLFGEIALLVQATIPSRETGESKPSVVVFLFGGSLLMLAAWGVVSQANVAQPDTYALVTRPDKQAITWIREYLPEQVTFLVEGFRIYQGRTAVGADAGWWLSLLAGRQNSMPPQYALLQETPIQPDYSKAVVGLVALLEEHSPASPEGLMGLCEMGITHAYIGQGQGTVSYGNQQLYSPQELAESPAYEQVYHLDRVYVFALMPEACPAGK